MTAVTTDQGYGNGITHPANRLSSLQQHTMTLLRPQIPHKRRPARNPRRRDIVVAPLAVRIDEVFDVKDDDTNMPLQPPSTSPHANGNTASNGFSNNFKSSHQTPLRPPPTPTTTTTNHDHPPPMSKSIYTSQPQH